MKRSILILTALIASLVILTGCAQIFQAKPAGNSAGTQSAATKYSTVTINLKVPDYHGLVLAAQNKAAGRATAATPASMAAVDALNGARVIDPRSDYLTLWMAYNDAVDVDTYDVPFSGTNVTVSGPVNGYSTVRIAITVIARTYDAIFYAIRDIGNNNLTHGEVDKGTINQATGNTWDGVIPPGSYSLPMSSIPDMSTRLNEAKTFFQTLPLAAGAVDYYHFIPEEGHVYNFMVTDNDDSLNGGTLLLVLYGLDGKRYEGDYYVNAAYSDSPRVLTAEYSTADSPNSVSGYAFIAVYADGAPCSGYSITLVPEYAMETEDGIEGYTYASSNSPGNSLSNVISVLVNGSSEDGIIISGMDGAAAILSVNGYTASGPALMDLESSPGNALFNPYIGDEADFYPLYLTVELNDFGDYSITAAKPASVNLTLE